MKARTDRPTTGSRRFPVRWLAAAAVVLASVLVPAPAQAAIDSSLQITKTAAAGPYQPGDVFSYTITTICSSPTAPGCINAAITDILPQPLVFDPGHANPVIATVAGGGTSTVAITGSTFRVAFTKSLGGSDIGLVQAKQATVTVWVKIPADASADNAGLITNTARIAADNADPKTASADVTLTIPSRLAVDVDKERTSAATVPATPGAPVEWQISGTNDSNKKVDTLVLQDPADPSSPSTGPFEYLDLRDLDPFTPPAGATGLTFEWLGSGGAWNTSYTGGLPVPGGPATMLPSPTTDVYGVRFTFTSATPAIPIGATATIGLSTVTRANVATIPSPSTVTVTNTVTGYVGSGGTSSATDTDDAVVSIANEPPTVQTSKSFDDDFLLGGESTVATIRSDNGFLPVHTMTIVDPGSGVDFDAQGLQFQGFLASDIEWPRDADTASITYTYAGGGTETLTTTALDTLPAPTGDVVGFSVTFTAPGDGIEPSAYASLPYTVRADPVSGSAPVDVVNTTTTTVTDTTARTGTASDSDTLQRLPRQISTEVSKSFTPDELYAAPGATTLVSLIGTVSPRPDSTIGSDYLTLTDPATPSATPTAFWDCFQAQGVTDTDIPAGTTLQLDAWNGTAWVPLASQAGPQSSWSYTIPSAQRAAIQGIRFTFTPAPGTKLSPGFNVAPNFRTAVRSGADCTAITADETIPNTVESEVANAANALGPVTADDVDELTLHSTTGGPGPDLIDKTWVDPADPSATVDPVTVGALTGETRIAKLLWSTQGLAFDSMTLTDPATPTELSDVTTSIYNAFDLTQILPITAAQDPYITADRVSSVQVYSDSTDTWVDITGAACAAGCVGQFGGYTIPAGNGVGQRGDVIGVRLTFVSRTSGEPVAISSGNTRAARLAFQVRDRKRVARV